MTKRKKSFWTRPRKILLAVVLVLVAARIALPYVMLHYANRSLARMDGYYGHIKDIDVALYRGAYRIDSIYINKVSENKKQSVFIRSGAIDLSLEWKALFKGRLVGELVFEEPLLRFTENRVELSEVSKDTADFREILEQFMPVKVNRCEIRNGQLQYIDAGSKPAIDLSLTHIYGTATNLRNVYDQEETLPSDINLQAHVYGGSLRINMKLNPLAKQAMFDVNAKVENMDLKQINDFFQAYASFDVNKGIFNMYAEAATRQGKFDGYVKPLITDLDVVSWKGQDREDNFWQKIWESLVGGVGEIFENQKKDQFGTKLELKGQLEKPDADIFNAIVYVLRNAFVQALKPSIDYEISFSKVGQEKKKEKKGLFKAVFGDGKKE